jgi:glycosyltransferase involved in cell wall biosynthesis
MTIIFLTLMEEHYSRTWTYYCELKSRGIDCEYIKIDSHEIWKDLRSLNGKYSDRDIKIVIGSASQLLVVPARLILKKKVYLDAGWSLFESTLANRKRSGFLGKNLLKNYFIDLLASQISRKIFLESDKQTEWYRKRFLVPRRKCVTIYTGLDESDFKPKLENPRIQAREFVVIFRGKNNSEAGLEVLAEATKILSNQNIKFIILSNEETLNLYFSEKTIVVTDYFPSKSQIATYLSSSDLSLGQLSNHKRLTRTIPHKAFESAYLGIPYLTARNSGVLEVFKENKEIFCFEPGSPLDLAQKIEFLATNPLILRESAKHLKAKYQAELNQGLLAEKLIKHVISSEKHPGSIPR